MNIVVKSQNNTDQEYFEAIKSNDVSKLEEMVKNAAMAAGFTIGPLYHGTNKNFYKFKPAFGNALWFTTDKGKIEKGESGASGTSRIVKVYLKAERIGGWEEYERELEYQLVRDFDAIKLDDDWIVFDPKRVKSSELITRVNGKIVPLSERFGTKTKDIRIVGKSKANNRLGRCYELSAKYVIDNIGSGAVLVYGKLTNPFGKGLSELEHAFVEIGNKVFDPVMEQEWPKEVYYDLFKVKEEKRYSSDEIMEKIDESKHWGPW